MCTNSNHICMRNYMYILKKVSFPLALVSLVISLLFCWIGFSVPDWFNYITTDLVEKNSVFGWHVLARPQTQAFLVFLGSSILNQYLVSVVSLGQDLNWD